MAKPSEILSPTNVMLFKNGLTSLSGILAIVSSSLEMAGLAEWGYEVGVIAAGLAGVFAKDGNKSSQSTGLEPKPVDGEGNVS